MSGVTKIDSLPKPYGQYILVKREEPEEETRDSGIIIPYQHRKLSQLGDVISLGSHSRTTKKGKRIPFDVKIGDQILFKWHAATTVLEFDDIQYLLLKEDDITMVIN
jgi:co-chaperonin GroES (HSP10)